MSANISSQVFWALQNYRFVGDAIVYDYPFISRYTMFPSCVVVKEK
jgi:hypothetical protein